MASAFNELLLPEAETGHPFFVSVLTRASATLCPRTTSGFYTHPKVGLQNACLAKAVGSLIKARPQPTRSSPALVCVLQVCTASPPSAHSQNTIWSAVASNQLFYSDLKFLKSWQKT